MTSHYKKRGRTSVWLRLARRHPQCRGDWSIVAGNYVRPRLPRASRSMFNVFIRGEPETRIVASSDSDFNFFSSVALFVTYSSSELKIVEFRFRPFVFFVTSTSREVEIEIFEFLNSALWIIYFFLAMKTSGPDFNHVLV